jgi:hypothetical protein
VKQEIYDYTGKDWGHRNSIKRFKENLEAILGEHSIDSLQKTAVHGTAHIIQTDCSLKMED